jgi:hypothetical protein
MGRRKITEVEKEDLDALRASEIQVSAAAMSKYYSYQAAKSYVNKMEKIANKVHRKPSMLLVNKHTGRLENSVRISKAMKVALA